MPVVTTSQRRARLVARHHLDGAAASVELLADDLVALHSSDPLTPFLAAWARLPDFAVADLGQALYERRSLWRLHGMRGTLFVVPTELAGAVTRACGHDIAAKERRRIVRLLSDQAGVEDAAAWLADVEDRTVAAVAARGEARTAQLSNDVPELGGTLTLGSGRWQATVGLASRVVSLLGMTGRLVRTRPAGSWRSSQYGWAVPAQWFPSLPQATDSASARARLLAAYLRSYGPAATEDVRWWTGWRVADTRAALADVDAVEVELADGGGWLLPNDLDEVVETEPQAALLPSLDPTLMGHTGRGWYLGDLQKRLFDRNGNAGPTVWWGGRVVGGWAQQPDGTVVAGLLDDVGREAAGRIDDEAARLSQWLDGTTVVPRFRTPLERELSAGKG